MHEILIAFVIVIIVAAQLMVGYTAWKKIDAYRQIIPEATNFETIRVYIPESQVKDINIDHILINLNYFQFPQEDAEEEEEEEVMLTESDTAVEPKTLIESENNSHERDGDKIIWISKENEEKKIEYRQLADHLAEGWSQI